MSADHDHDHGPDQPQAHGHGDPFIWDPDAARQRKGRRLILAGVALVLLGALSWWLGTR